MKTTTERRMSPQKKLKSDCGSSKKRLHNSSNSLIFDNGSSTIKLGYTKSDTVICLPNYIMKAKSERKRCFIADQIEDCRDLSGLFYIMPNDHGYISKYDVQKTVWDYMFNKFPLDDPSVIMTQPLFNFRHVQEYMDEIFFEEYDVKFLHRTNPTDLSRYQYLNTVRAGEEFPCLIVDSGFSFTHIVPYINGKKYTNGIVRLDIGGKLLTNYLKDILSYRQLHVMEETYVINQVKEDTCFMSANFKMDMIRARKTNDIVKNYILPDFHNVRRGYMQEESTDISAIAENCQILRLNNERICVPEVLLRPAIIPGMDQCGLAHCIAKAIEKCPEVYRAALCSNIVMTGGNCCFPGFKERLLSETRMYLPSRYPLRIHLPEDPIKYAWMGGQTFSLDPKFRSFCVSKDQYEEYGPSYTFKKFNDYVEIEEQSPVQVPNQPFSYLAHWNKLGVDLFQKKQMTHVPRADDVQFMLEGDNIEQLDGKYVDIEFEFENKLPKPIEVAPPKVPEPIKRPVETPTEIPDQLKLVKRKKTVLQFDPTTNSFIPNPYFRATNIEAPKLAVTSQIITATSSGTQPGIKHPVKVYKPVFKPRNEDRTYPPKRIITLAGNTVTLNGNSILVPTSLGGKTVLNTRHILNNAVIFPQNLLSKNVTLQLIPIKPELLRQGNVATIITKKTQ